jgi:hypothetical protein
MQARVVGAIFSFIAPSIWIFVVPLARQRVAGTAEAVRSFIGCMLLPQFLQAFPVGGIQETWGTFLFMPLVALGLAEARQWATANAPVAAPWLQWQRAIGIATVLMTAKIGWTAIRVQEAHGGRLPLGLPGAERLRLSEPQRTAYRILALNAAIHADVLFTMPGMLSFNLWTNCPTPTQKNTTAWFTLLDESEQREIIAALEQSPRACIIVEERLIELMQAIGMPPRGVLHDFIVQNFTPAFRIETFAFLVRKGRAIAPFQLVAQPASEGSVLPSELTFCLVAEQMQIGAIEASKIAPIAQPGLRLNASNTVATLTPIDSTGRPIGPRRVSSWPLAIHGLALVQLQCNESAAAAGESDVFYLRSPNGDRLAEVRR